MFTAIISENGVLVPLVVMVVIIVMIFVTVREVFAGARPRRSDEQDPNPPFASVSSETIDNVGFLNKRGITTKSTIQAYAPVDMIRGESDVARDDDDEKNGEPGRVAIKTYHFRNFEAQEGPPDWSCFYDELSVEFYDPDSGSVWLMSYFVTTPAGIAKLMQEENWKAMFGNNHLIVARYDVRNILDAVLREINAAWETSAQTNINPSGMG